MFSFEGGTLSKKTGIMLRSRDVIHRRPASFWFTIHVPVSAIIPVVKKKALFFFCLPSYINACFYNKTTALWLIKLSPGKDSGVTHVFGAK